MSGIFAFILLLISFVLLRPTQALPRKEGIQSNASNSDPILEEGRRLISSALKKEDKEAFKTAKKFIRKMRRKDCNENLFKRCQVNSKTDECGCQMKCQFYANQGRCMPAFSSQLVKRRA